MEVVSNLYIVIAILLRTTIIYDQNFTNLLALRASLPHLSVLVVL